MMKHNNFILAFLFSIFLIIFGCASTNPLIKATKAGDSSAVQKLIDTGVNINEPDSKGYNALFYAIEYGQYEIVKNLISKGANIESKDLSGMTPLVFTAYWDFPNAANIIKLLIKRGADINAKSPEGETVLDFALSSAQGDILDDIIKARGINLWVPEAGKARIYFVCSDLYDHIKVTVGKQSKKLNPNRKDGVIFIDVDTGKHIIDANHDQYVSKNRASIDVIAGQTYYFKVSQNMRNRIVGYALVVPSTLVDKITSTNPFPIIQLQEAEAKANIKEILKSKELK
ncbi:MAG TPA: ankyrin repeat domain-containing protein [Bacillota bacterium]|jgi:ankyrin repeat protein|nr:ankyrin repeat domain-containing protein [Bacillota bacterium]